MRLGTVAAAIGGLLAAVLLGVLIGYAAGRPSQTARDTGVSVGQAAPIPGRPSLPIDPPPSYAPDPDYPPLETDLTYTEHTFRTGRYVWHYDVPKGWVGQHSFGPNDTPQVTWRPADETQPDSPPGGYQLRIAPVSGHFTPLQLISAKTQGLLESASNARGVSELVTLRQTADSVWYDFRDNASQRHRLDDFAWVDDPGPDAYVGFELSVTGRVTDRAGLDDLLAHVRDHAYRTTRPQPSGHSGAALLQ